MTNKSSKSDKSELAILVTSLGVMSTAAELSEQLMELSDKAMGQSVDALMTKAGLSIEHLEAHLRKRRPPRKRKVAKGTKRLRAA